LIYIKCRGVLEVIHVAMRVAEGHCHEAHSGNC
jgi:hypothetical protein